MMVFLIYSLVTLVATLVGAITGVGGGSIIKPVFDLLGVDTAVVIGLYSLVAVFSMCLISIYRQYKQGLQFEAKVVWSLSVGSLFGGYLGEELFRKVTDYLADRHVKLSQSLLLLAVLAVVAFYTLKKDSLPHYQLKKTSLMVWLGLIIGLISIFLGIGGGPLNIVMLMFFFSYSAKEASIYSLLMIFSAQLPKILLLIWRFKDIEGNLFMIPLIILFSFLGGLIGTQLNRKLSPQQVEAMYLMLVFILMLICGITILRNL